VKARHAAVLARLRGLAAAPASGAPAHEPAHAGARALPAPEVHHGPARTLRVPVETLDRLLDLTGEIAVSRGRLGQALEAGSETGGALDVHREAERPHAELQELVMRVRMVPLGPTLSRTARIVRDAATALGKKAQLVVEGDDVEVDTKVVELIADPLGHLVRNAVAHGIELPEARVAAGKDPGGTVRVQAVRETGRIVVSVSDDGAGLDRERILEAARRRGVAEETALAEADVQRLIFEPGFTTAAAVDSLSGRGVGLDVVRRNVESLRGTLSVTSVAGQGTTFTIRLPLTLAIIQGFAVAVSGEAFLVPLESVLSCLDVPAGTDTTRETGVLDLRGEVIPFVRLRHRLGIPGEPPRREHAVIVQHRDRRVGLVADVLLGDTQAVIKPLGRLLRARPGLAGSTIRGNGTVALLLDVSALVEEAISSEESSRGVTC
jgi:two-component system chemotaxis sensor kinase CheA